MPGCGPSNRSSGFPRRLSGRYVDTDRLRSYRASRGPVLQIISVDRAVTAWFTRSSRSRSARRPRSSGVPHRAGRRAVAAAADAVGASVWLPGDGRSAARADSFCRAATVQVTAPPWPIPWGWSAQIHDLAPGIGDLSYFGSGLTEPSTCCWASSFSSASGAG
jgi:hypothetical protein